jgi:hypothetical protein
MSVSPELSVRFYLEYSACILLNHFTSVGKPNIDTADKNEATRDRAIGMDRMLLPAIK